MDAAAKAGPAAEQWEDIRRFTYGGLACYAALLALSVACDATASYFSRSAYRAGGRRRVLPRFMALRYKMRNFYRNTSLFYYIAIARFALNTVVCVLYVAGTYRRSVTRAVGVVYRVFGGVFTVDLLVRVSSAESALIDAASVPVFFQAMSLPSMFLARGATGFLNFSFLRALTAYESYRAVTRRIDLAVAGHNKRFVIGLVAKTCTLVYLLASGVQLLELPGDVLSVSFLNAWHALGDWHFLNAVYFVVVTLTTVGTSVALARPAVARSGLCLDCARPARDARTLTLVSLPSTLPSRAHVAPAQGTVTFPP
jgi:Ion channel